MTEYEALTPEESPLFTEEDVLEAMREIPGYIDVTPGDFAIIFAKAFEHARNNILRHTTAGVIMRQPAVCIFQEQTLADLIHLLAAHGISGVPVLNAHGTVAGVVSEKDILRALGRCADARLMRLLADNLDTPLTLDESRKHQSLKHIMSTPAITVGTDTPLADIIAIFQGWSINRLPVTTPEGAPLGVITRHNIIKAFGRFL